LLAQRRFDAPNIAGEQEKKAPAEINFTNWPFFHSARNEFFNIFGDTSRMR
jgi:hypothetical protein